MYIAFLRKGMFNYKSHGSYNTIQLNWMINKDVNLIKIIFSLRFYGKKIQYIRRMVIN